MLSRARLMVSILTPSSTGGLKSFLPDASSTSSASLEKLSTSILSIPLVPVFSSIPFSVAYENCSGTMIINPLSPAFTPSATRFLTYSVLSA